MLTRKPVMITLENEDEFIYLCWKSHALRLISQVFPLVLPLEDATEVALLKLEPEAKEAQQRHQTAARKWKRAQLILSTQATSVADRKGDTWHFSFTRCHRRRRRRHSFIVCRRYHIYRSLCVRVCMHACVCARVCACVS